MRPTPAAWTGRASAGECGRARTRAGRLRGRRVSGGGSPVAGVTPAQSAAESGPACTKSGAVPSLGSPETKLTPPPTHPRQLHAPPTMLATTVSARPVAPVRAVRAVTARPASFRVWQPTNNK